MEIQFSSQPVEMSMVQDGMLEKNTAFDFQALLRHFNTFHVVICSWGASTPIENNEDASATLKTNTATKNMYLQDSTKQVSSKEETQISPFSELHMVGTSQ